MAYFLEIFLYLSFALMLGVMVQRSGLTIILLLTAKVIELIIRANTEDYVPWLIEYYPLESIWNLVPFPYARYAFQEIQDYISWKSVGIALGWTFLFNYFSYLKLKKSDL
jgi:ABC-type transport system involved in multi-copper enzyme maturation permease subunit